VFQKKKNHENELKYFIRWYIKNFSTVNLGSWLKQKVVNRLLVNWQKYDAAYYPIEIRQLIKATLKAETGDHYMDGEKLLNQIEPIAPSNICLSSIRLKIHEQNIDWHTSFDDPEDEESLHRWNWLLQLASDKLNGDNLFKWAVDQQVRWVKNFHHESKYSGKNFNKLLRWESYTVGERIANSILFFNLMGIKQPPALVTNLVDQVRLLIGRLEYYGNKTGNHVFNNARAIYLAGVFYRCDEWRHFAKEIFKRELPIVVTEDGFLREGSSHYQYLFTRWLLEILYFAELAKDKSLINNLNLFIEKLMEKCAFFYPSIELFEIPLIGDISPDFPPVWLNNLAKKRVNFNDLSPPKRSWDHLWNEKNNPYALINVPDQNHYSDDGNFAFPQSGWCRFNFRKCTLFMRADQDGFPNYVGHHHHDAGHFCMYHNGEPLLVDGGRLNYLDSFGITPQAHNSITINGLGFIPLSSGRYPRSYSNCENSITWMNENDNLIVNFKSDGFNRLGPKLRWHRCFQINDQAFNIQDRLEGEGKFILKAWFHWDRDIKIFPETDNIYKIQLSNSEARFLIEANGQFLINNYYGGDHQLGWQCLAYGKRVPAYTLEIVKEVHLPENINYSLIWV